MYLCWSNERKKLYWYGKCDLSLAKWQSNTDIYQYYFYINQLQSSFDCRLNLGKFVRIWLGFIKLSWKPVNLCCKWISSLLFGGNYVIAISVIINVYITAGTRIFIRFVHSEGLLSSPFSIKAMIEGWKKNLKNNFQNAILVIVEANLKLTSTIRFLY